ncbi:MAG TPA: acVLRF1 family peptidyl-tRNA hydrolase [Streptosporangiaceae bacterium]|nr:acVLRF1 family peptidyl-tRNA hydrolase [Streptosporangiaceae bacterium]
MAEGQAGARWVEIPPERLVRWVENFTLRHGPAVAEPGPEVVVLRARDGATAACHPPFPPLPQPRATEGKLAGPPGEGRADPARQAELMAAHAAAGRTVGVLLARLGGYAVGVFTGDPPRLAASKTGSRLVHGRAAAGGWSQHRFARRRENQATAALRAAADTALAVLGPHAGRLDAVVLGGDRRAMASLRADPRLAPFMARAVERFLTVPDPRLAVLKDTPRLFRAIRIRLTEPG